MAVYEERWTVTDKRARTGCGRIRGMEKAED
jgi:hypothetical protein